MGLGRRHVGLDDPSRWVFNRMADAYPARPAYPEALLDALVVHVGPPPAHVLDIGAGVGHVALPLTARGFDVLAAEPARAMLDVLQAQARAQGLAVRGLHARAESLPVPDASVDGVIIADALHFVDAAHTAHEVRRVLAHRGALAIVTCEFADTPFMGDVQALMHASAPRRPRDVSSAITQFFRVTAIDPQPVQVIHDHAPVDHVQLECIMRSISFIGPAMHAQRFAAFRDRLRTLADKPVWSRRFTVYAGRRRIPAAVRARMRRPSPNLFAGQT